VASHKYLVIPWSRLATDTCKRWLQRFRGAKREAGTKKIALSSTSSSSSSVEQWSFSAGIAWPQNLTPSRDNFVKMQRSILESTQAVGAFENWVCMGGEKRGGGCGIVGVSYIYYMCLCQCVLHIDGVICIWICGQHGDVFSSFLSLFPPTHHQPPTHLSPTPPTFSQPLTHIVCSSATNSSHYCCCLCILRFAIFTRW